MYAYLHARGLPDGWSSMQSPVLGLLSQLQDVAVLTYQMQGQQGRKTTEASQDSSFMTD